MGILKKSVPAKPNRSAITIIAEGNKFSGDMSVVGKMHIDGIFEGSISSLDNISIGQAGHVSGVVKAKELIVSGLLEGEVYCDELHIEKGGKVRAIVSSKVMAIDPDGCFLGERKLNEKSSLHISHSKEPSGVDAIDSLPDKITLNSKG
jgi:cytoskeletal protein CcmA (bactofilin family)